MLSTYSIQRLTLTVNMVQDLPPGTAGYKNWEILLGWPPSSHGPCTPGQCSGQTTG